MMLKKIESVCFSTAGLHRACNEDNFLHFGKVMPSDQETDYIEKHSARYILRPILMGVFDGMGGMASGEIASRCAAAYFCQHVPPQHMSAKELQQWLFDELVICNKSVGDISNQIHSETGTTAAIMIFYRNRIICANVGDSRIYRIRNGVAKQLTTDHTDANLLDSLGITGRKPCLLQYLGMNDDHLFKPAIYTDVINRQDVFLCCSDGISSVLNNVEIASFALEAQLQLAANNLVSAAQKRGSKDNCTLIICKVR